MWVIGAVLWVDRTEVDDPIEMVFGLVLWPFLALWMTAVCVWWGWSAIVRLVMENR